MKISITIREMNERASDFDGLCSEVGLNPWCMNEGLATGDEVYEIEENIAVQYGLIRAAEC